MSGYIFFHQKYTRIDYRLGQSNFLNHSKIKLEMELKIICIADSLREKSFTFFLSFSLYVYLSVCVLVRVWWCVCGILACGAGLYLHVYIQGDQRRRSAVLVCQLSPYSFETGSPSEYEAWLQKVIIIVFLSYEKIK